MKARSTIAQSKSSVQGHALLPQATGWLPQAEMWSRLTYMYSAIDVVMTVNNY